VPAHAETDLSAEYGEIRMWVTAADCAVDDRARAGGWGGQAISVRLVLAALGQAAMVAGSRVIEFGTRNLALHAGVSYRTVARVLELLRDEPDPLVDLVSPRYLWRADRYQLLVPDAYADQARWRRRRAGRIEAIHPVFAVLGGAAGLVYAALSTLQAPGAGVARAARLSESAAAAALKTLAEYGLAEHGPRGWARGPVTLDTAAAACGADCYHQDRCTTYGQHRTRWRAKIESWLAPSSPDRWQDDGQQIPADDILEYLDPPAWYHNDPGPPEGIHLASARETAAP
jgi:hypothetical protein